MPWPTSGPLRLVRACVVSGVVVALASLAHVLGGGVLPPVVVLAALAALVLAGTAVLAGRRIGTGGAFAALAVGQLALHQAFELFSTTTCAGAVPAHTHHADHVAALAQAAASCTTGVAHASASGPLLGGSAMLVAHVVATVAAAGVIAGTDRALMWLAAWLRPLVERATVPVVPVLAALPVADGTVPTVRQAWREVVDRRGPPAGHAPVAP